jgi:hypothetical protein
MKLNYKKFTVCSIIGCYLLTRTGELCKLHSYKLNRYGDAEYVKPKKVKEMK